MDLAGNQRFRMDQRFQEQAELFGKHGSTPRRCFIRIRRHHADRIQSIPRDCRLIKPERGAPLSPKPGPMRRGAKGGAEVPHPGVPDHGDVSARTLLPPKLCGAPTYRVVELVQEVEPGVKKSVALLKRSHRCLFNMAGPGPHGRQNSAGWLRSSCNLPGARRSGPKTELD